MADVSIHHASLESAIFDLQQEANNVVTHMDNLAGGLLPLRETFQGDGRVEFDAFEQAVSTAQGEMRENLRQAIIALQNMHDTHRTADRQGANTFAAG
ncbi:WXG100 family type VII secretion target [Actinosynnema sp. NPDC053489]|uniref:WXG100 family type VII secretion target n=1 Tax=Actinosynnema sp. NPDC053489 TaxID=3363916 RepID=UPI0037CB07E1